MSGQHGDDDCVGGDVDGDDNTIKMMTVMTTMMIAMTMMRTGRCR
jgi:hypothetical protein